MQMHEELFQRLQKASEIRALIGKSEELHLECKTWPANENEAQKGLAKALCGFANADGGVLVIGLEARNGPAKDDPDLIQAARPVADAVAVKSRIENLVGELVEPGLEGIRIASVIDTPGSGAGFVLVGVPPSDGFPCRSRKDWRFYQRISAGTHLMEYYRIVEMFGRRRRPLLRLHLHTDGRMSGQVGSMLERSIVVGIENAGRGIAKFPSLRFKREPGVNVNLYGIDGNYGFGLPQRPSQQEWIVFGGGADHVIYPGTTLEIAKLDQRETLNNGERIFSDFTMVAELTADEAPATRDSKTIPGTKIT